MIHEVLVWERPKSVGEIGCFQGFSTSAIIEADEIHPFESVDLIDPNIKTHLKVTVPARWNLLPRFSGPYQGKPECWIIDGEHEKGAHVDYGNALAAKARIIVIHDSNAGGKHKDFPFNFGSAQIADKLRVAAEVSFEDKVERLGEMTHRGILIGFFYVPLPDTLSALRALSL